MYLSKKTLPRRRFLQGLGATLGLPLLDAMIPAATAQAQTAAAPVRRAGFIYVPHGAIMDRWTPAAGSGGLDLSPILQPLEPYRESVIVVSNLSRNRDGDGNNHAVTAGTYMTGVNPRRTEAEDVRANTTIDQVVARAIGQETPFPSLELATEDFTGYIGGCDIGYSCAYVNTLCWSSPTTPLPMDINPRVVFERLFGTAGTKSQRARQRQRDRSVLDAIADDARAVQRTLGAGDGAKLNDYLDNVREIERRIERTESQNARQVDVPDAPVGIPEAFEEHALLMYDLLAIAYQADLTRVATFMVARELSQRTYPALGIAEPHHSLSHHQNDAEKIRLLATLQTYHMTLFARFLERLKNTPDGDGSLLDHMLLVYGSGMSNSNGHTPDPLPTLVVGGDGGRLTGNRHIETAARTPLPNFWLGLAQRFGGRDESFGLSNGVVAL